MFSSANAVLLQAAVSGYEERKTSKLRRKNRSRNKDTAHLVRENLTGATEGIENSGGRRNNFMHTVGNALKVLVGNGGKQRPESARLSTTDVQQRVERRPDLL